MITYTDSNDEVIDITKVLTILLDIEITGSSSTDRYFLRNRQYMFVDTSVRSTLYWDCELTTSSRNMLHYRVVIEDASGDDENFYIPECFIAIEGFLRAEFQQDVENWKQKKADQPKNVVEEYEKISGIDLDKRHEIQYDGYEYWLEAKKKRKKKSGRLFRTEQDDENNRTY